MPGPFSIENLRLTENSFARGSVAAYPAKTMAQNRADTLNHCDVSWQAVDEKAEIEVVHIGTFYGIGAHEDSFPCTVFRLVLSSDAYGGSGTTPVALAELSLPGSPAPGRPRQAPTPGPNSQTVDHSLNVISL
jgi:hypothetical protein